MDLFGHDRVRRIESVQPLTSPSGDGRGRYLPAHTSVWDVALDQGVADDLPPRSNTRFDTPTPPRGIRRIDCSKRGAGQSPQHFRCAS